MRKLLAILLLTILGHGSMAQNYLRGGGSEHNDEALALASDASGNTYATGYFTDQGVLGGHPIAALGYDDIFVSKTTPNGTIQWVKTFGGNQPDRAYGIAADNSGNTVVTGYVTGTAVIGGTSYSTYNSTQDLVVVKYDGAGNVLWARTFGGPSTEIGYSVDIDQNDNIVVVGQFKDSAYFDNYSFYSSTDPNTGQPSQDIFILKLDANGNVLWAKHGAAPYEDRAMTVSTDMSNNIYVAGQFSDTITFTNTYNNNMLNAGFLMKLDPSGSELWLDRMAGSYVLPYDMTINAAGNVLITGDYGGQMIILVSGNPTLNSGYAHSIFVAEFDPQGEVTWKTTDGSDNKVSSRGISLDGDGDVYITGYFECTMTEYSNAHDDAVFNSVGFRDVFVSKYTYGGAREWEQHYGGPADDYASDIEAIGIDNPAISGSYETIFNVPSSPTFPNFPENVDSSYAGPNSVWLNYCSTSTYGHFTSLSNTDLKDILLMRPVESGQGLYDYYERTGSGCNRPVISPLIEDGLDTAVFCDQGQLELYLYTGKNGVIGPEYDFNWNTGQTSQNISVTSTGLYWVDVETKDGCKSFSDSIYVQVYASPSVPTLNSSYGPITPAIPQNPCLNKLLVEIGDTATIWGENITPGYTTYWQTPSGTIYGDTIETSDPGLYLFVVEDPSGNCSEEICLEIWNYGYGQGTCKPSTMNPIIVGADTVEVCEDELFCLELVDSALYANGLPTYLHTWVEWTISGPMSFQYYSSFPMSIIEHLQCFAPTGTGNCSVTATILHPVTQQPIQSVTFDFYLIMHPDPVNNPTITGPQYICLGDTVTLIASGGDNYEWNGSAITDTLSGGTQVLVNAPGTYTVDSEVIDSITGCTATGSGTYNLQYYPQTQITMNPASGLMCPNDSVQLTAQNGLGWEWIGPQGNILDTTQSVWVYEPGFYYCNHTNFQGCTVISEWVEVIEYATPYLEADPGTQLCANGTLDVSVVSNAPANIWWDAPLSSSNSTVTIDSAGVYTVSVTQCGITTSLDITITQSSTQASITPLTDTIICPSDTAIIQGPPGMTDYDWSNGSTSPTTYATDSGYYWLTVIDGYGCSATSDSVYIDYLPQPAAPTGIDTTVCYGDDAVLVGVSPDSVQWFDQPNPNAYIQSGDSLFLSNLTQSETYYVAVPDSICYSLFTPVTASISQASQQPTIYGDPNLCFGEELLLYTDSLEGFQFTWVTPSNDTITTSNFTIDPFTYSDTGTYTLSINDSVCSSADTSISVSLSSSPQPSLSVGDTAVCPGTGIPVDVTGIDSSDQVMWSNPIYDSTSVVLTAQGTYWVSVTDSSGCTGYTDTLNITHFNVPPPPNIPDTTVCQGDDANLVYQGNGQVQWMDDSYSVLSTTNSLLVPNVTSPTTILIMTVDSNNCATQSDSILINISVPPPAPTITGDSIVCHMDQIVLNASGGIAPYTWSTPNGTISNSGQLVLGSANASHQGIYQVWYNGGTCTSAVGSFYLTIQSTPSLPSILADSIVCEGETLTLTGDYPGTNDGFYWEYPDGTLDTASTIVINGATDEDEGSYTLTTSVNGCSSGQTTYTLNVHSADDYTINDSTWVCVGDTAILSAPPGHNGYSWMYNNLEISDSSKATFTYTDSSGSHYVDLELQDIYGCQHTYDSIVVYVVPTPVVDLGNDTTVCMEDVGFWIDAGSGYMNYNWDDGSGTHDMWASPRDTFYSVDVEYAPGCFVSDTLILTVIECHENVSDVFTPNGDGMNDTWTFKADEAKSLHIQIYNRWGTLMYEINSTLEGWDGTNMKNGKPCAEGVYFYSGTIELYDGTIRQHQGYLHLFR